MRKNYIQKTFGRWLKENQDHLPCQPNIFSKKRNIWHFNFQGITPIIRGYFSIVKKKPKYCWLDIDIIWENEHWDSVFGSDLTVARDCSGKYYCQCCWLDSPDDSKEPIIQKYNSYFELFTEHTFNYFLDWANEKLKKENILYIYGVDGASWARIHPPDEVVTSKRDPLLIVPLGSKAR